ncbi:MAG: divalent-cation tolerance protein CutA [Planctomycetota bacterium]|jgi:periplasmic divalent cation tolerance protein
MEAAETPHEGDFVSIYSTAPDAEVALGIGRALVEAGLAACVNVIPGAKSVYVWEGTTQEEAEAVFFVKTRRALAEGAIAELVRRHPYDTPCAVTLPVLGGSDAYLDWLRAATRRA